MKDRERAHDILLKNVGKGLPNVRSVYYERTIDAMIAFRNEGLREELVKFLKEYHKSMFVIDLENTNIDYGEIVDEYLNTKQ